MKKRTLTAFLAVALTLCSVSGCGNGGAASDGQSDSLAKDNSQMVENVEGQETGLQENTGKVEFWNDKLASTEQSDLDKLAESASTASGVNVEFISYTDVASMRTAVEQSIHSPDAPGLFTWWSGVDLKTLADAGVVEDLTSVWEEYIIPNGVPENVTDSLTFDGKIYAAPYSIIYSSIVYNKDLFDQYGLKEPETFEEFENVCQTLVDNGITPLGVDAGNGLWGFKWFQCLIAAYDPQLYLDLCANQVKYTDERVVEVMDKWKEMYDKGFFSIPLDQTDLHKAEASGEIAMQEMADYEAINLCDNFGGGNYGTFVMPPVHPDTKKTVFFEIAPICVSKNSADKGSAIEVLKTWYGENNQRVFNEVTNFSCSSNVESDNSCAKEMVEFAVDSENYNLMLRYYENAGNVNIRDVAIDQLLKFELGDASVLEILNTIQAKADEVLGEGYAN